VLRVTRLVGLSVLNLIRNPLRQAVLYPWVILTIERWAEQRYHLAVPTIPFVTYLGAAAVGIGALLCLVTMVQFVVDGAGTAEGYAGPVLFIRRGAFKWTRNPLYLGMTAILLGESLHYESLPLLIYALYWLHEFARRVQREESRMLNRFGDAYLHYTETTPRWLPGQPGSRLAPAQSELQEQRARRSAARGRRHVPEPDHKLRNNILRVGQTLTLFALVGYLSTYLGIFSPSRTPFLWFDPVENLFHLVPGLTFLAVASLPGLRLSLAPALRPLLVVVGLAFLAAAIAGFALARRSAPNILGVTNFENPVENVIHWVVGVQCLFAATKEYLVPTRGGRRNAPCPA
jgi:protein-S-isoprenylcysteine O-methyltransferase Ste14